MSIYTKHTATASDVAFPDRSLSPTARRERHSCPLCGAEYAGVVPTCPSCGESLENRLKRRSVFKLVTLAPLAIISSAFVGVFWGTMALTIVVGTWFARNSRVPGTVYFCTAIIAWPSTAICKHMLLDGVYKVGYAVAVQNVESHRTAGTMDEFMVSLMREECQPEPPWRRTKWEPVEIFRRGHHNGWRSCFSKRFDVHELARERVAKDLNTTVHRDDLGRVVGVVIRQCDELQADDLLLLSSFWNLDFLVLDGITIGNGATDRLRLLEIRRLDLIGTNVTNYEELLRKIRELRVAGQEISSETQARIKRRKYPSVEVINFGLGEDAIRRCRDAIQIE